MTRNDVMDSLEVHVFGGTIGESIVLRLPNGLWGVVDCYARDLDNPDSNYAIKYLLSRGVRELEFLCLTHPHEDHYRGMSQILERFKVHRFWRFAANTRERLIEIISLARADAIETDTEPNDELQTILHNVKKLRQQARREGSQFLKKLEDIKVLYSVEAAPGENSRFEIACIAPSSEAVERYEEDLHRCFDVEGRIKDKRAKMNHNRISAALVITFGMSRVVLGGDVEREQWEVALRACDDEGREMGAQGVKVSHHGSANGYCDGLWERICCVEKTHAVITPYLRHRLPSAEGLGHIGRFTRLIYATSRSAVARGLPELDFWEDYPLEVKQALATLGGRILADRETSVGRCSLTFDGLGSCTRLECFDGAGQL